MNDQLPDWANDFPPEARAAHAKVMPARAWRWPVLIALIAGNAFLVYAGVVKGENNDFQYSLLLPILFLGPAVIIQSISLLVLWRQRLREGWFDDSDYDDSDFSGDEPPLDEPITHPEPPQQKSERKLSQEEWEEIWRDTYYKTNFLYSRNKIKLLIIGFEEGLFFAPIAFFGLGWPWLAVSVFIWGLFHYPMYPFYRCVYIMGMGMVSGLLILPHGILTHALGHYLYDYLAAAWERFTSARYHQLGL